MSAHMIAHRPQFGLPMTFSCICSSQCLDGWLCVKACCCWRLCNQCALFQHKLNCRQPAFQASVPIFSWHSWSGGRHSVTPTSFTCTRRCRVCNHARRAFSLTSTVAGEDSCSLASSAHSQCCSRGPQEGLRVRRLHSAAA